MLKGTMRYAQLHMGAQDHIVWNSSLFLFLIPLGISIACNLPWMDSFDAAGKSSSVAYEGHKGTSESA
jgi:hypothetical protein